MDEDGVLVKAEDGCCAGAGGVGTDNDNGNGNGSKPEETNQKAATNEHRVAELSLDEGGGGGGIVAAAAGSERAGPGPIDNRTLGEGRELREGMVSHPASQPANQEAPQRHPRYTRYPRCVVMYGGVYMYLRW